MRITEIKISNFRSIVSLELTVRELAAICGLNSCGKSNVMRALRFAFIQEYSQSRMADNLCNRLNSPNAACKVTLNFDEPTAGIANVLGIPRNRPFAFSVAVKKNGVPISHVNGVKISDDVRQTFVNQILVVHVPPIRDIAAEGLAPFKATLAQALRNTRNGAGSQSFTTLANEVRSAVEEKGRVLLGSLQDLARNMLRVDDIAVDASGLDLESLLPSAALKVRISGSYIGLDKLGTGHQSSVIIQLYRQLGQVVDQFVLYLFEEPDNHLHPSSMRAIAAELGGCAREANAQVFLTTHSPHLINQFDLTSVVALESTATSGTKLRVQKIRSTERQIRVMLGKFGLRPAEALLAEKVIVVEGPNDVTAIRSLIALKTGKTVDELDYLVIPAGGKESVADLCSFLNELGVHWWAIFDRDAADSTDSPHFRDGLLVADVGAATAALSALRPLLSSLPTKQTAAEKMVDSMLDQLTTPPSRVQGFAGSTLERFLTSNRILTPSDRTRLEGAIFRNQPHVIRSILSPVRIWLWPAAIEEVIAPNVAAENNVEATLLARGLITHPFPPTTDRRRLILKKLKGMAHEPAELEVIIETLWAAGRLNSSIAKAAAKALTE